MAKASQRKAQKFMDALSESEKASSFIRAGIRFALDHGMPRDSQDDLFDSAFELHRAAVIGDLITILASLAPRGKPPSTSKLIEVFNEILSHSGEVAHDIAQHHQRFFLLVDTFTKPKFASTTH